MGCACGRQSVVWSMGDTRTHTTSIQRPHIEDIHPLHLAQDLQALETSRLVNIGRDGTRGGTGWKEVVFALDLCSPHPCQSRPVLQERGAQ